MDEDDLYTRITLRIPRELHERLTSAARLTSKSMNAEIIGRLNESFDIAHQIRPIMERPVALQRSHPRTLAQRMEMVHALQNFINLVAAHPEALEEALAFQDVEQASSK